MNFDYNEEQQLLADSVRRFLQKDYSFERRRQISKAGHSEQVWSTLAQMGLTGLPIPADYGGFGGGAVDLMSVMEAFGEALVMEPYLPTVLGALAVAKGAAPELKQALLPAVVEGRMKLAFAPFEPAARFDFTRPKTTAERSKTAPSWVLHGEKSAVEGAPHAERIVVTANAGGAVQLFVVEAKTLAMRPFRSLDDRSAASIVLDGASAQPLRGGLELAQELADFGAALVCAEAVGAMKSACDATLEYLKTRKQFGVPIGTFQALQHRIVDLYVAQEQARSMACLACSKVDSGESAAERARCVSAAKIKIADSARLVSQESVQLHGGMGMSEELKVSHTFRRLTVLARQFGDADHHLERFASL